jgi:hypothetical protein
MLFDGTSVNGSVMLAPPQVPVSACIRDELNVMIAITATNIVALLRIFGYLAFTALPIAARMRQAS